MKEKLLMMLVSLMLERLSSEQVKKWLDNGLDTLEDAVLKSPNKYDDLVVLPIIKVLRETFAVED